MMLYVHRNLMAYQGPGKNGIGTESPDPPPCSQQLVSSGGVQMASCPARVRAVSDCTPGSRYTDHRLAGWRHRAIDPVCIVMSPFACPVLFAVLFVLFFGLLLRCHCLITRWVFKEPGKQSGGECLFPGVGIHNYSCLCQPNTTAQDFLLRNKNDNNKNCRSCRDFVKRWSCFHVILYGRARRGCIAP